MGLTEKPKQDLIAYRLAKANEVYQEAIDVASMNHWNLTVNRLYYSIFHAATALLLSAGNTARTHNGVIRILMKDYVRVGLLSIEDGKLISSLFNMRHTGDYDDLFDWDQSKVEPLIEPTRLLLEKMKSLVPDSKNKHHTDII